jgi:hypothetical protein
MAFSSNFVVQIFIMIFSITLFITTLVSMESVDAEQKDVINLYNIITISLTILITFVNIVYLSTSKSGGTSAVAPTVQTGVVAFGKMLTKLVRGKCKKGKGKGK